MGYIKNIANQPNLQSFPGALFEQHGSVPIAQCQETEISGIAGQTSPGGFSLSEIPKFAGIDLTGKILQITAPPANVGLYGITGNSESTVLLDTPTPGFALNNVYTVKDSGQTYLTRNQKSFIRFIIATGYAYTVKGGILYTDCPNVTLEPACSDTWSPLT